MRCFLLVLTGISAQFQSFSAIYQAETAVLCKAITETKNSGYIGDAYVILIMNQVVIWKLKLEWLSLEHI